MDKDPADRRLQPRYAVKNRVCVTLPRAEGDSPASDTFYCTARDLSTTGLQFTGITSLKKGDVLDLLVVRESAYWGFSLRGRVAWVRRMPHVRGRRVGIAFTDMPEATRIAWEESIARAAEKER